MPPDLHHLKSVAGEPAPVDDELLVDDPSEDAKESWIEELEERKREEKEAGVKIRVNLDVRRSTVLQFRRVSTALPGTRGEHMHEALRDWCEKVRNQVG